MMGRTLYRTQVLLEREQHEQLRELAAAEDRSMSELVREAVAVYLSGREEVLQQQEWEVALARLAALREAIRAESGEYPGDLVAEMREERANEQAEVLWGDAWRSS